MKSLKLARHGGYRIPEPQIALMLEGGASLDEITLYVRAYCFHHLMLTTKGNQCEAARKLRVHRNTLQRIHHDFMDSASFVDMQLAHELNSGSSGFASPGKQSQKWRAA